MLFEVAVQLPSLSTCGAFSSSIDIRIDQKCENIRSAQHSLSRVCKSVPGAVGRCEVDKGLSVGSCSVEAAIGSLDSQDLAAHCPVY